ncbi:MAG: metallophosphoesterase family protein [Salinivenus sp.]
MTIAHISDLHFGRLADPGVVDALGREINGGAVDLVALSGDLTQRARPREFAAAQDFLSALDPPLLVVPGNHDVYPWWRPVKRLLWPLQRYKHAVTDDLAPSFATDGVAVLGIATAHGATIKGGRITDADRAAIHEYFSEVSEAAFRVLVLHHHLTKIRSVGPHDVARYARETLEAAAAAGVHLILCGHLHVSHVETLRVDRHRIVVASAGTATSNRWRAPTGAVNFYNRITIASDAFDVEERRYVPRDHQFVRDGVTRFDRAV